MLRTVFLYGALGRKFGNRHRIDITTAYEAVSAMTANYPGFRREWERGAAYSFIKGPTRRAGSPLEYLELTLTLGANDIHIIPAAYGRGGGGGNGKSIGKIILGVAIMAVAVVSMQPEVLAGEGFVSGGAAGGALAATAGSGGLATLPFAGLPIIGSVTAGQIAGFGAMMALSGIAQMISPTPQASPAMNLEAPDARAGFIYNGPANTAEQGGPIALIYGRMIVGSTLVNGSIATDRTDGSVSAGVTGTTARLPFTGGNL